MAESSSTLGPGQDPESLRNPQPLQKMMREFAPVFVADSPFGGQVAVVAKHEDILTVLRTPEIFSSMDEAVDIGQVRPLIPLQIDPPEHAKYRKLLDPLFAPKRMLDLEAGTRKLMSDLVDAVADKNPQHGDYTHTHKALHQDAQHVLASDQPSVEESESWGHQQHHRGTCQQPSLIPRIEG
jgi:cytochrome P450